MRDCISQCSPKELEPTHTHTHRERERERKRDRQSQRFKKLTHTVEGKLSPKSAVQAVRLETPDKC